MTFPEREWGRLPVALELALVGRGLTSSSAAELEEAALVFLAVMLEFLKNEKMDSLAVRAGCVCRNPIGRMGSCVAQVVDDWGVERPFAI
jgi:hypothetical protein